MQSSGLATSAIAQVRVNAEGPLDEGFPCSLAADVASFYLVLRDFDNRQIIAESTVETRRQTLDIIQARFNAGAVSEVDVNQAQIQLAEAEAAVESLVQLHKALGGGLRGTSVLYWGMIKSPHLLQELDRRYEREALADLSYDVALQRFAALWAEARELGAIDNEDWLTDLKPDLAIARVLNGLPSTA